RPKAGRKRFGPQLWDWRSLSEWRLTQRVRIFLAAPEFFLPWSVRAWQKERLPREPGADARAVSADRLFEAPPAGAGLLGEGPPQGAALAPALRWSPLALMLRRPPALESAWAASSSGAAAVSVSA